MPEDYSAFVPHPRFGQKPRFTNTDISNISNIHFKGKAEDIIQGTAITADWRKQKSLAVFFTHYFDLRRTCAECKKPFIFYAEEQKHWYEDLSFSLIADCTRCPICRKKAQSIAQLKRTYQDLAGHQTPTVDETLKMAELCIHLMEISEFPKSQIPHARELINIAAKQSKCTDKIQPLIDRINAIIRTDG